MQILKPEVFDTYPEIIAGLTLPDSSLPGGGTVLGGRGGTKIDADSNRASLAGDFGVDPSRIAAPLISFTDRVVGVDEALQRVEADAVVTNQKGWLCMTTMADCFPVLAFDPAKKVIGSMHNGWPNTQKNLAMNFVEFFVNNYQSNPADIILWIGPGLGGDSFEVTEEFLSKFDPKYFKPKPGDDDHWIFDHRRAVNDQFEAAGIKNITNLDHDTKTDDRYFSARRLGADSGRMGAAILLR